MSYLNYDKQREFEDKIGWKTIISKNETIGKFLEFTPRVEYAVCKDNACCYSPSNVDNYFPTEHSQKVECERYLKEQAERFPNGWVTKDGYQTTRLEYYPQFHNDWNNLIEAVKRLKAKGHNILIDFDDIYYTWQLVSQNCQ